MRVYFDRNFLERGKGKTPGKKISVGETFTWAGSEWTIPAIYRFPEGIAADFCVRIPLDKVKAYLGKWYMDRRISELSEEELEEMQTDNPFDMNFHVKGYLDGEELESMGMCMVGWHPLRLDGESVPEMSEMLMDAYGCSRDSGWNFIRAFFRYRNGVCGKMECTPESVLFRLEKNPVFYPGNYSCSEIVRDQILPGWLGTRAGRCISVIGTDTGTAGISDGPTSVFLAGKINARDENRRKKK